MTPEQFMEAFGVVAEADGGIEKLRTLVLSLAVSGRITQRNPREDPAHLALVSVSKDSSWRIPERIGKKKLDPAIEAMAGRTPPAGWVECRLEDCLQLINGRAYSANELLSEGTPVIRIQNLNGGQDWYYSNLELPERQYCTAGDLLFAWSASFGPYIWSGPRSIYHYHIWKLNLSPVLAKRFIYYVLLYLTDQVRAQSHGLAMLHMTKAKMERWPLLLPPLAEQHRIVAKVDQLMSMLDDLEQRQEKKRTAAIHVSKASLDSLVNAEDPDQLARAWERVSRNFSVVASVGQDLSLIRESVLTLGALGRFSCHIVDSHDLDLLLKLMVRERDRTVPAGKWRESSRSSPTPNDDGWRRSLARGWRWVRLQDVCRVITDGDHQPPPRSEEGIPFLTIGNVSAGRLNFEGTRFVPNKYWMDLDPVRKPALGDILYTVVGTYGRPILVDTDRPFVVQRHIAILKPSVGMNARFLRLALASRLVYDQATASKTGTAQPTVALGPLRRFWVPVATPEVQEETVAAVDRMMSLVEELERAQERVRRFAGGMAGML